jgi:hypothetical protein
LSRSHRSQQTGSSAQVAPWLRRGRWNCIPIKAFEVKTNNNNRAAPRGEPLLQARCLFHSQCLEFDTKTPDFFTANVYNSTPKTPDLFTLVRLRFVRASCALRRSRAQRASVRSTRTPHRLRTRNRSSQLRCFPPWCPASTPAPSEGTHATPFVSLTTVGLSACLFSQSRAAADQMQICLPPLHPRALHCT